MFLYIILVAIFGVAGDILINQWARTELVKWWLLSVPVWVVAATVFGIILRQGHYSFGTMVVVILLLHSCIALTWDALVEGAVLTPMQWVGVGVAIVAIILIEVGRK
jgi:drug/metabolite transporter superfamily protein YnfA